MTGLEPDRGAGSAAVREALRACASGDLPANIAAMRLLMESRDPDEAGRIVAAELLLRRKRVETHEAGRLQAVLDLLHGNPDAWRTIKTVLEDVRHDEPADDPDAAIRRWAAAFDRAARGFPEGSVALYALGNPDLLRAATREVVSRLQSWGLTGRERRVLDLGCGIGRFGAALADEVGRYVGIDISAEMIEAARRRCAGLDNVSFRLSTGHDLAPFQDGAFDLVLAVDVFPYLVQSGMELADTHVAEAARVLRSGGDLLILNFSYRGDPALDRADIRRLAEASGFAVMRDGARAFGLWDGLAYHLAKPPLAKPPLANSTPAEPAGTSGPSPASGT